VWDDEMREEFMAWSERVAGYSEERRLTMTRFLDKYLSGREIRSDEDIEDARKRVRALYGLALEHKLNEIQRQLGYISTNCG